MRIDGHDIDTIILSGGRNRRMEGRFKGSLTFRNEMFLDRIVNSLKGGEGKIFLSYASRDQAELIPEGCKRIYDSIPGIGPAAGLISGLKACTTEYVAVCACDMPLITPAIYTYLWEKRIQNGMPADAVIPRTEDMVHPLVALYRRDIIPKLEDAVRNDERKMHRIIRNLQTVEAEIPPLSSLELEVTNINTVQEYRTLICSDFPRVNYMERQDKSQKPLELEEAIDRLKAFCGEIKETMRVPFRQARGRILAEDVYAPFDQPPFPRSPFDGYAIRAEDTSGASGETPAVLSVIEEIDAGAWSDHVLQPGEAIRIMTGAPIPAGANAIIKQEETDYGEDKVEVYREMRIGQNYISPGEDYKKGTKLLPAGTGVGPVEIGILSSAGKANVLVYRKPRAIVISTGDELCHPGEELVPGKIYDSNLFTLEAQLLEWGVDVLEVFHSPDEPSAASEQIKMWADHVDLIITTGGVSVGKKDIMHDVFRGLDIIPIFWKVGIKPGAAMMAGKYRNALLMSLSGNPYASFVDLHMLVRPVLTQLTGRQIDMVRTKVTLMDDYDRESPIRRFLRSYVENGKAHLEGHRGGNGDIAASRHINALIDVPAGSGALKKGMKVTAILL